MWCQDAGMESVNIGAMLARFTELWAPKKIAELNDYDVKIVKIQGDFTWHSHADTDELFLVIDGALTLQLRHGDIRLGPGELYVRAARRRALPALRCRDGDALDR